MSKSNEAEVRRIAAELYAKNWNSYVPKTATPDWLPEICLQAARDFIEHANKREAKTK